MLALFRVPRIRATGWYHGDVWMRSLLHTGCFFTSGLLLSLKNAWSPIRVRSACKTEHGERYFALTAVHSKDRVHRRTVYPFFGPKAFLRLAHSLATFRPYPSPSLLDAHLPRVAFLVRSPKCTCPQDPFVSAHVSIRCFYSFDRVATYLCALTKSISVYWLSPG